MKRATFAQAIEEVLAQAMAIDERIIIFGEDVHMLRANLLARFGKERVLPAPISESAFVGAAVGTAMAGLKPIVEVMLADFLGVAIDALLNHAAKVEAFSGGTWKVPMVVRTACGGGYGDGGQHEQSLWGWLAHIPGLGVVIPSTPADAGGLMLGAIEYGRPVVYMEHKLLTDYWLDYLGTGGRKNVTFDVPQEGAEGIVPDRWEPIPLGKAAVRRKGTDITIAGVGVDVHRALTAAKTLEAKGISAEVLDLRSLTPLDLETIVASVRKTGRLLAVDEDYLNFGLSGELAAIMLEARVSPRYMRVGTETTIPYNNALEKETLPSVQRILEAAEVLFED